MKLIDRHLLGSFFPPFGFGLAVTTFLLMINVLQNYINLFLEKGIRLDVATEVLVLSLGHTIALTVPMATLIGVLMAMGHLASDQEVTAMKACGISLYRLSVPLMVAGVFLTGAMVAYNQYVLPGGEPPAEGTASTRSTQLRPTLQIKAEHLRGHLRALHDLRAPQGRPDRRARGRRPLPAGRAEATRARTSWSPRMASWKRSARDRIRLDLFNGEMHRIPDSARIR